MSREIVPAGTFLPLRPVSETPSHDTVEQLTYVLFKRWRLILGCLVTFLVAATVVTLSRPTIYRAEAKILLKPDRVSLQISELSPQSARTPYSAQALQSEIEMIRSRDVLQPVATALLSEGAPGRPVAEEEIEAQVRSLSSKLRATALKDASVIEVTYSSPNADEVTPVLDRIVNQYREHHALAYGGSGQLIEFYERERQEAAERLKAAEEELQGWQQASNVVAVDPRIAGLLQQQSQLEQRLKETTAASEMTLQSNPLLARLKGDQMAAEMELNDLRQRYTDNDRRVREKREHVSMIRNQKSAVERALLASLGAEQASLERQIQGTAEELAALREKKLAGDRLARAVNVAQDAFLLYGKKLEDARISSNLDRAHLSSLAIIEQAHRANTTDLAERVGFVVLAAIVGLTLGLTLAFGFEFFNKALRTRRDVEVYLGVPVLAAIPNLRERALPDLRQQNAA